jgi:hypothetical protein
MVQNMRIWLAPILTIVLLFAHAAVQRQADYASAENASTSYNDRSPTILPILSILEASDFPGNIVTIRGKITSSPATAPDGSVSFQVTDETGSLLVSVQETTVSFLQGDKIQATGRIGGHMNEVILRASQSDIVATR